MFQRTLCSLVVLLTLAAQSPVHAQPGNDVRLTLVPLSGSEIRVDAAEWARLPRETVQAHDAGGPNHAPIHGEFAGVSLRTLLTRMGVPEGPGVRGVALRLYVVAEGSDGYRVLFSLAELDPGIVGTSIIVADRHEGATLDTDEGPLRIIAPGDKRPARWVRGVVRLSVYQAP